MITRIAKFANTFYKQSQLLPPGGSTMSAQEAIALGTKAKKSFDQIDKKILGSFEYKNFEFVVNKLSEGIIPDQDKVKLAIDEFEGGLKIFSSFDSDTKKNFKRLIFIERYFNMLVS
jgi:hypothetical protein